MWSCLAFVCVSVNSDDDKDEHKKDEEDEREKKNPREIKARIKDHLKTVERQEQEQHH